jgi:hypothetical protein
MSPEEKQLIERWIIENVDASVVPDDEGNTEALIYNLLQLLRHGRDGFEDRKYNYLPEQDAEISTLLKKG